MKRKSSIRNKYLLPVTLMVTVLLVALGVVLAVNSQRALRSAMEAKGNAVADFITGFSAEYFAIFDFGDFDNFAKAIAKDDDVVYFLISNPSGEPLNKAKLPAEGIDKSDLLVYKRDIQDSGGNVQGRLEIGYSKAALSKSIRQNVLTVTLGVLIGVIVLTAGIAFLTRLIILRRVEHTVELLKDIAQGQGDLTRRLPTDGDDELGELSAWFNTFVENIQKIIQTAQGSVAKVSAASHQLSGTAETLARGANDQAKQTELVATSMEEMSQSILDVAHNASIAAKESHDSSQIAIEGKDVVDRTVQGMLKIAKTVSEASSTISELGEGSREISNIIKVIGEIADQTNLLALNAAIEAARAGEQGRGFAVVADEVRKLAERTTRATKEIQAMIEKIQGDTERSVNSMNIGSQEVEEGVRLAEEARKSLDSIVQASTNGEDMVQRIATASEQQSSATNEVTSNMEAILRVSQGSRQSTQQIRQTSEELERLSNELQRMIGAFKA